MTFPTLSPAYDWLVTDVCVCVCVFAAVCASACSISSTTTDTSASHSRCSVLVFLTFWWGVILLSRVSRLNRSLWQWQRHRVPAVLAYPILGHGLTLFPFWVPHTVRECTLQGHWSEAPLDESLKTCFHYGCAALRVASDSERYVAICRALALHSAALAISLTIWLIIARNTQRSVSQRSRSGNRLLATVSSPPSSSSSS